MEEKNIGRMEEKNIERMEGTVKGKIRRKRGKRLQKEITGKNREED